MRRADRLVRITRWLVDHPNVPISLSDLSRHFDAAKSSLSEDVSMIRQVFSEDKVGTVESIQGSGGGIVYRPLTSAAERVEFRAMMEQRLADPSRILPGGFLYMSDVLGDPYVLDHAGRQFAEAFGEGGVNVVVTIETKGIPLAVSTARYLNVPTVVVRREHRVTEGAALTKHYISGSMGRIQTMSMSIRAMPRAARALIVDDFMRAGATAKAVIDLLAEFSAEVVGTAVFMATAEPRQKLVDRYVTLFSMENLEEGRDIVIRPNEQISLVR